MITSSAKHRYGKVAGAINDSGRLELYSIQKNSYRLLSFILPLLLVSIAVIAIMFVSSSWAFFAVSSLLAILFLSTILWAGLEDFGYDPEATYIMFYCFTIISKYRWIKYLSMTNKNNSYGTEYFFKLYDVFEPYMLKELDKKQKQEVLDQIVDIAKSLSYLQSMRNSVKDSSDELSKDVLVLIGEIDDEISKKIKDLRQKVNVMNTSDVLDKITELSEYKKNMAA